MAVIKNISSEDRIVPGLGGRLVYAGQEVEVPVEGVTAYTQQETTWAPADAEATEAHEAMLAAIAELLAPPYDPADHTVDQVRAYVEAHPDQREVVLALEEVGKNRSTLVESLTITTIDDPQGD